jgi:hypothetical protein
MSERQPTQYAGCYSLHLYCDGGTQDSMPDGVHTFDEFPHEFTGETFGECAGQARKRGWKIYRKTRTATCPKCSGSRP